MRYRKLTDDGDMVFGTGSDYHIRTAEGVAQAVATRLRLYKGEWRYDKRAGVPWRDQILGKLPLPMYDGVIRAAILNTPGVTDIVSYSSTLERDTRALTVEATIATEYGEIGVTV